MPRLPLFLSIAAVCSAFASLPLEAADKASAPKAAASKPVKTAILTPAQLRDCETLKGKLRAQNDSAVKAKQEVESDRAAIDRSGAEIKTRLETLDRTSAEAVDAYNADIAKRDQAIEAYQARVAAYNIQVTDLGALKDNHEKTCEARRYDERDLADLKRGKK